jgi:hypothetical protein
LRPPVIGDAFSKILFFYFVAAKAAGNLRRFIKNIIIFYFAAA